MGAPNMPKDTGEKVTKAQHPYKKGEVDGDKNRYHDMYKHVEEHLITLTRYRDASAADEESTKDIFELIDKYARRRHWKRLAPLLVVALCFEPESIAHFEVGLADGARTSTSRVVTLSDIRRQWRESKSSGSGVNEEGRHCRKEICT